MKTAIHITLAILAIDALSLLVWIASGQFPTDGFYAGAITSNVLGIFIN